MTFEAAVRREQMKDITPGLLLVACAGLALLAALYYVKWQDAKKALAYREANIGTEAAMIGLVGRAQ